MESEFLSLAASFIMASAAVYACLHLVLGSALLLHKPHRHVHAVPGSVSVLIAAHNEEDYIKKTLEALQHQTVRPKEIIIIDDRSTDRTAEIVTEVAGEDPTIRLLKISDVPEGLSPKKNALSHGISASTGEILCFTDADCLPQPGWIEGMVRAFDPATGVVIGSYRPFQGKARTRTPLMSFMLYEKLRSGTLSWGSALIGFPWTASGSSFAYRRVVFDEVGGFRSHQGSLSGDDDLLLHDVRKRSSWKVGLAISHDSIVATRVPGTFKEFVAQRKRHFSAGRHYRLPAQIALALYHALSVVSLCSLPFLVLAGPTGFLPAYLLRVAADAFLLAAGTRHRRHGGDWIFFIGLEIAYVLYTIIIGPLGLFGSVSWKARNRS